MVAFSAKKSTFSIPVSRKAEPLPAIIRSGKEFLKLKIPAAEMKTADFIAEYPLPFPPEHTIIESEEPLFRGFLWGRLRARGWKESRICLFQALLFAVGHVYYVGTANISAFLVVPLGALIFGLSAWRTRSIGTSMIAHGITNAFGNTLANVFCGIVR